MFPIILYGIDSIRQVFSQRSEYKRGRQVSRSIAIRRNNRDLRSMMHDRLHLTNAGNADRAINSDKSQPLSKQFGNKGRDSSLIKQNGNEAFIRRINLHAL